MKIGEFFIKENLSWKFILCRNFFGSRATIDSNPILRCIMKKFSRFSVFVLTIATLLLSACGAAAATATPNVGSGRSEPLPVAFIGTVDSIAGDQWVINGQTVTVSPDVIRDGPFEIGDQVKVEGVVNTDGSFLVSRVEVPTPQDSSSLPPFGDDNSNDSNSNDASANSNDANTNDDNGNDVNANDDNGNDANSNDDNGNDANTNDDNGNDSNSNDDDDSNSNDDGGNGNSDDSNDNDGSGGGNDNGDGDDDDSGGGNDDNGGDDDNDDNGNDG
jgi:hypothetical protein